LEDLQHSNQWSTGPINLSYTAIEPPKAIDSIIKTLGLIVESRRKGGVKDIYKRRNDGDVAERLMGSKRLRK